MEPEDNITKPSEKGIELSGTPFYDSIDELLNSSQISLNYNKKSDKNLSILGKLPKAIDDAEIFLEKNFGIKLKTHEFKVQLVTVSKNENYLASISGKSVLTLWNLCTSRLICKINLDYSKIVSAEFSSDEKKLWIATKEGNLDYFELESQKLFAFHVSDFCINFILPVFDDKYIWYSTFEQNYVFVDNAGNIAYKRRSESLAICGICARKSKTFYFGTISSYLYIYQGVDQFERLLISSCDIAINCLSLCPDELTLGIGLENNQIVLIDLFDYSMEDIVCEKTNIYSIFLTQWHTLYATFEKESNFVHCYDLKTKSQIKTLDVCVNTYFPLIHLRTINKLLYHDLKDFVKSLSLDNFESKFILSSHFSSITCIIVAANGGEIITGGRDSTIRVWDVEEKIEKKILDEGDGSVTYLFLTFNKEFLVSGCENGKIFVWNSETYQIYQFFCEHKLKITTISCDFTSRFIVSCSEDRTIKIWEINSSKCFESINIQDYPICSFLTKYNQYHIDTFISLGTAKIRVWKFRVSALIKPINLVV